MARHLISEARRKALLEKFPEESTAQEPVRQESVPQGMSEERFRELQGKFPTDSTGSTESRDSRDSAERSSPSAPTTAAPVIPPPVADRGFQFGIQEQIAANIGTTPITTDSRGPQQPSPMPESSSLEIPEFPPLTENLIIKGILKKLQQDVIDPGKGVMEGLEKFQYHIVDPGKGVSFSLPSPPSLLGLAGVPGFGTEAHGFRKDFLPWENPDYRELIREEPKGEQIIADIAADPTNLIPFALGGRVAKGVATAIANAARMRAIRAGASGGSRGIFRNIPANVQNIVIPKSAPRVPFQGPIPTGRGQLALSASVPRTSDGTIIASGRAGVTVPEVVSRTALGPGQPQIAGNVPIGRRGPVSPVPDEPTLIMVTSRDPGGEMLTFTSQRSMRLAAQELGQRGDVVLLPGNATPADIARRADELLSDLPLRRLRGPGRPLPGEIEVGNIPEIKRVFERRLRVLNGKIRKITVKKGSKPNSPANIRLRALKGQAVQLEERIKALRPAIRGKQIGPDLDIAGLVNRRPMASVVTDPNRALGPGFTRPASTITPFGLGESRIVSPGVERIAQAQNIPEAIPLGGRSPQVFRPARPRIASTRGELEDIPGVRQVKRGDVPFEASSPEEAAHFRQQLRGVPEGQRTVIPPPEEVLSRAQAKQNIAKEFLDVMSDSPGVADNAMDVAATAYLSTGKIVNYIRRMPKTFEVAKDMADGVFKEVGRVSAKFADPTRTIQAIDFGYFGSALQRGLMWPTRRTLIASLNWGDATKIDYRKMLDRHGIRSINPRTTSTRMDSAGDVLEEIGTNELNVDTKILVGQMDHLLMGYSDADKLAIVGVAKDTRLLYDNLIRIQNAARSRRGQDMIPKLQNYRPWIRETNIWAQIGFADLPGKTLTDSPIPPDFIKPNTAPNPRARKRTGGLEGYEKVRNIERLTQDYIETARKDIFYTNIIQNGKAHIKALKEKGLENSAASIEDWIMEAYAGKLPSMSKAIQENLPPKAVKGALMLRRSLTRSVFPLNWTWNVFIQTSSAGLIIKHYGLVSTFQGLDYLFNKGARHATHQFAYASILKRRGAGKFALQDIGPGVGSTDVVQRSAVDTVESYANFLTNIIEDNLTGIGIRAAYHDGVRRGMKGRELWEYASEGGSKTQSMYNLEDLPGILRSKEVGATVPFQTFAFEIMNTVRESGLGLGKTGARIQNNRLVSLMHWFGMIVAFNIVGEKLNNRQPWQLSSFIPFFGLVTSGFDPTNTFNMPLPLKYTADLIKGVQDVATRGDWTRLRSWAIKYHMLGGTQIDRTLKGIEAVADGEVTDIAGRQKFAVDSSDWKEVQKAVTQGIYSTSEGREYIDDITKSKGPGFSLTGIRTDRFFPPENR